jgi:hypothetical protein
MSILQVALPWFLGLGPFVIICVIVFCIWQWHRNDREMKDQVAQEQERLLAAEHYINSRLPRKTAQRKKWWQ